MDTLCGACLEDGFQGRYPSAETCACGRELDKERHACPEYHCCEDCARKNQVCKLCGRSPVTTD
jgi:hypothetical protein